MTVVHQPEREHHCDPGWTWTPSDGYDHGAGYPPPLPKGTLLGNPPSPSQYPKGTVWQCGCGQTWVSRGALSDSRPGVCYWRREGRWERRRRERRTQR